MYLAHRSVHTHRLTWIRYDLPRSFPFLFFFFSFLLLLGRLYAPFRCSNISCSCVCVRAHTHIYVERDKETEGPASVVTSLAGANITKQ